MVSRGGGGVVVVLGLVVVSIMIRAAPQSGTASLHLRSPPIPQCGTVYIRYWCLVLVSPRGYGQGLPFLFRVRLPAFTLEVGGGNDAAPGVYGTRESGVSPRTCVCPRPPFASVAGVDRRRRLFLQTHRQTYPETPTGTS